MRSFLRVWQRRIRNRRRYELLILELERINASDVTAMEKAMPALLPELRAGK